jgi:hypothetical protein
MFVCQIWRKARTCPRPELDRNIGMTSAYLNRPEIPLAAALSRMLEQIEAELANNKLDVSQEDRLRWRAELIRKLLTLRPVPERG